ncbi:hypothetical protein FACS189459_1880 [Bacilli bacterium]|nr:hypothetical protein FACS189459_1880 [Bacilli bacterium]
MSCSSLKTITTNLSDINNLALNKGGESFSFCGYSGGIVYNNNELLSSSTVLEKLQSDGGLFNSWVAGNDSSSDNIDISGIFSDTYSSNEGTFFNPIKNL